MRSSRCFSGTCVQTLNAARTRRSPLKRGLAGSCSVRRKAASLQSSVATTPPGTIPRPMRRGFFMRGVASFGAVLALFAWPCAAQQVDNYSIPKQSKYSLESFAGRRPLTRAERTNFAETSHYDDVVAFIDSLKKLGAKVSTGSIAKTIEGRELPYVIASRPLVTTPAAARRLGHPIADIQANIHAGEVEGKEAMQSLLRDLLFDKRKNVLDSVVLIVQPIYNADGNEKWGPQTRNRGAQNGPELVGTRQNASNWNLNRDYIGADAPETKGAFAMLNAWNPDLFMDLHTTDGSIHGYALTYAPPLTPTAVNVVPYTANTMLPEIRKRVRERHGWEMQDYGDFRNLNAAAGRGRGAPPAAAGRGAADTA